MKNLLVAIAAACLITPSFAQELVQSDTDLFEIHVRPTLINRCLHCHGEDKQEGGLSLTAIESILSGGDSGPAIDTENAVESLLLSAIKHESLEMPPDGKLEESTIAGIEAWLAAGAPWPSETVLQPKPVIDEEDRAWWCYQPIVDPDIPHVSDNGWCRNEIDHFILDKLQKNGLTPSAEATAPVLLRRLTYGLTGLPPKPDKLNEIASGREFYSRLVDELLADNAYGEQQARYWLDLVRYADSDGYRADAERPHARKYRDYVIRAMNADMPYDRFVHQQLAGDEMFPGDPDAIIATMYLRHWIYEHNQRDVEQQWHEILSDVTETTADVFLAQGLKCARCHDHKYDPLLQKDFYRLKAFFAALMPREDLPVADIDARIAYNEKRQAWEQATFAIRKQLFELENPTLLANATREGFDKFIEEIKQMIIKFPAERDMYEKQIAALAERQYDLHPELLPKQLKPEVELQRQNLLAELQALEHLKPAALPTQVFVASDVGETAPPTYIDRDPTRPAIEPGYLSIFDEHDAQIEPAHSALQTTGRRSTLAKWMTRPDNPLTARVIVNRIWQQHFGVGLVASSSDFGRLGTPPSHPELLDWLASRLIEDGWSLKTLHRRIVTSATYRQTSLRVADEAIRAVDPSNRWLWRMNPRRLDGEEIMDSLLAASEELGSEGRAIYQPVKRNSPLPLLASFDGPDRIRSISERHRTTTATQSLLMLNSEWTVQRSSKITARFQDLDHNAFVAAIYRTLYARAPTDQEIHEAIQFMYDYTLVVEQDALSGKSETPTATDNESTESNPSTESVATNKQDAVTLQEKARIALTHVMLNASELIYVD